jgi:hypothetical protein
MQNVMRKRYIRKIIGFHVATLQNGMIYIHTIFYARRHSSMQVHSNKVIVMKVHVPQAFASWFTGQVNNHIVVQQKPKVIGLPVICLTTSTILPPSPFFSK